MYVSRCSWCGIFTLEVSTFAVRSICCGVSSTLCKQFFSRTYHGIPSDSCYNLHNLFAWYQHSALHPLVKSAIFHYEFEFIHPFSDGNGRMGRMWHTLLLAQWKELFFWLPVEELIQARQQEYYDALGTADAQADSAGFVELMLKSFGMPWAR